jgi:hypothetical protein
MPLDAAIDFTLPSFSLAIISANAVSSVFPVIFSSPQTPPTSNASKLYITSEAVDADSGLGLAEWFAHAGVR